MTAKEIEASRGRRTRRARISSITSLGARGIGMAVQFFSVPLMARYLTEERYGFFLTATSLAAWLTLADLGIGNGVTNHVAQAAATDNRDREAAIFTTSLAILSAITASLALAFLLALPLVPWRAVFAVSTAVADSELHDTILLVVGLWLVSIPLGVVEKAQAGYQAIFANNAWSVAAGLTSLLALLFAVSAGASLPWIVLAVNLPLPLIRCFNGALLLAQRPWLVPNRSRFDASVGRALFALGGGFFVAQIAAIGMWQTGQIIVAQLFGAHAVGPYVTTLRLCTLHIGVLSTWLAPLWPATTDAATRGDYEWVRARYRSALGIVMATTLAAAVAFGLLGQTIVRAWAGPKVVPSQDLVWAAASYLVVLAWCQVHAILLNALGRARGQAWYGMVAAVLNIGLSILLGHKYGLAGVCGATTIATLPAACLAWVELRMVLKRRTG